MTRPVLQKTHISGFFFKERSQLKKNTTYKFYFIWWEFLGLQAKEIAFQETLRELQGGKEWYQVI